MERNKERRDQFKSANRASPNGDDHMIHKHTGTRYKNRIQITLARSVMFPSPSKMRWHSWPLLRHESLASQGPLLTKSGSPWYGRWLFVSFFWVVRRRGGREGLTCESFWNVRRSPQPAWGVGTPLKNEQKTIGRWKDERFLDWLLFGVFCSNIYSVFFFNYKK